MSSTIQLTGAYTDLPDNCKLNVGCGRDIKPGWINLDKSPLVNADVVMDINIERFSSANYNKASEIYMSHVLEHLTNPLHVMEQLWLVAKPDCRIFVRVPYGSSDNAWEDQTHVRPYFMGSFAYFSQMYYRGADYGYRGDWEINQISLDVFADRCSSSDGNKVIEEIRLKRNMVNEMQVLMRAVKPMRDVNSSQEFNSVHEVKLNFI